MEYLKDRVSHWVVLCVVLVGSSFIFINWSPSASTLLFQLQEQCGPHPTASPSSSNCNTSTAVDESYKDKLDGVLAETSMEGKMLIIAMFNKAYVEGDKSMLDIFLDGFWSGEGTRPFVDHLLLVSMDQTSWERCKFLRLHCYRIQTTGDEHFDKEELFMSRAFIDMMWRRTLFLKDVLTRGYSFIFTDTDILWLRDPFPRLNESVDLQVSVDRFNGKRWSEQNPINTGFYMIRSNNKTIKLFEEWYARRNNNSSYGLKEQDVLENMMHGGMFRKLGLKVRFLETVFFSGFCQNSKDIYVVTTFHANCCRTVAAKVTDLTAALRDWKRFKASSPNQTVPLPFRWSKHKACANTF
ncbi:uncharacterized protein At1g28695-like [Punica granatum]|uniref:Glycosyltransferase n=2 Tax=Punica granatum TaxID=22663 RepID=A0A218X2I8_PUNGR|nr:uncharacterized protein At1g28695-like [Punica granatum]OWM79415.1 hypothetical protein CDL15_Pgr022827 [Punica granatum]PKI39470.1 hypothetical protein CRG98_040146 [Punica granatum]